MELNFVRVSAEISDGDSRSGQMKLRFVPNQVASIQSLAGINKNVNHQQ